MEEIDNLLRDLVAIATRRKPGQVTHKIAEIKEFIKQNYAETKEINELLAWKRIKPNTIRS